MSTTPTLADLLTIPDQDSCLNEEVLPELQKRQIRTTDWLPGSVVRAFAYIVALMRVSVRRAIAAKTAAQFEDYAFGVSTPPPNLDGSIIDVTTWCDTLAKQRYGVTRIEASYTKRRITLTNTVNSAYGPLTAGSMIIQFPSGNRYVLDETTTIPASGSGGVVTAIFRSYFKSDTVNGLVYNDAAGSSISLVTSNFPGVTATNPKPTYSSVAQSGSSAGTVTPSGTPASSPHSVALRIDTAGNVSGSTVAWSTNVDNAGWVTHTGASASNLGGVSGLSVTIADAGGNPNFVRGETYYWTTPGSDVTQAGADIETPQALGTRCRALYPSLAFPQDENGNWIPTSPTINGYEALALSANAQVRVAFVTQDATVNNVLNIVIAGQGGAPVSGGVLANVQSFFDSYSMITDSPNVVTTTARAISLGGLTITCKADQVAAAKAAMTLRLQTYLGGVDQSAVLKLNGLIDYDYIISLVRTTPGVTHVGGTLTINGGTTDLQLPVTPGAYEAASWAQSADGAFSW